jgi:hypothetical protein
MNNFFKTMLLSLALLSLVSTAQAATISISAPTDSLVVGREYRLPVKIVLAPGEKIYSAEVALQASATNLKLVSFQFADEVLPLKQAGYDVFNRTTGQMIKTAGFAGGITGTSLFGTLTIAPTAAGQANLEVVAPSQLLNDQNKNSLTNFAKLSFNLKNPEVVTKANLPTDDNSTVATDSSQAVAATSSNLALAQVATTNILGLSWRLIVGILVLVFIIFLGVDIFLRTKTKN